ncbi:MAG: DEAD/DEAH box helicase [Bacteroidales bacterium]|nr:DEAD/DEAH box helicase [Bacteroidales bacterium]
MKQNFFALAYTSHRRWGDILIPHMLEKDDDMSFYTTGEVLLRIEDALSYQRLSPMQKQVVNIVDAYNEKKLHRIFSKKKTVKEFLDTVDEQTIKEHIRPYIEKHMYEAFKIASENHFNVFLKSKSNKNIFEDDFLKMRSNPVQPYFHFHRTGEGTMYWLSVLDGEHPVDLMQPDAALVCNNPALVILNKEVYFVKEIEGKRLLPFFNKERVHVRKEAETKYYKSFVANTLRAHDAVEAKGFTVSDIQDEKKAILSLEFSLERKPVCLLKLNYGNFSLYPSSKQKRFLRFDHVNDEFRFQRFSRDPDWEESLEQHLDEIGLKSKDRVLYTLRKGSGKDDKNLLFELINHISQHSYFLRERGFILEQRLDRNYLLKPVELQVQSYEKEDWFDLNAKVEFGGFAVPFIKLRQNILDGDHLYILPDDSYAVIPEDWFARYKPLFEFCKAEGDQIRIHKQHFSQVDEAIRREHAASMDNLEKLNRFETLPEMAPPIGLNAKLRDYQLEGYAWLWLLQENGFGGCLADDMGLGKTLQTLAILQYNKETHVAETFDETPGEGQLSLFSGDLQKPTSLVVVPASLIQNWMNETERFLPSFKALVHAGTNRKRSTESFRFYDLIISSYHTVRQDIEFLRDYLFHYVILDESQMIKNPHSKLYRSMRELQSSHKLVLTGTPIENSLIDLWSQINFVNEGLLGTLIFFKRKFVNSIEKKKDKDQELRLKELISPFILRRKKEEVARELPPVYEQYRFCNMTEEQNRLYEEEKSSVRNMILDNLEDLGTGNTSIMVLKALTRLRQLSNHPSMLFENYSYGSGKYDEVFRDIESVVSENHKVLLFSSFVKHLDLYARELDDKGLKYAMITGSTNKRAGEVEKFQEDPECRIFLISLKAGGVGLNLTAADYVFIVDPWWNPAAEMQALSRAHRIGQDKNVFVYRFISNHTVEEKIVRLQERKSELAKTFVASNNPLRNMKKEDILELFS